MLQKCLGVHKAHERRSRINICDQLCWIFCISFISFHYRKDEFVYVQNKKTKQLLFDFNTLKVWQLDRLSFSWRLNFNHILNCTKAINFTHLQYYNISASSHERERLQVDFFEIFMHRISIIVSILLYFYAAFILKSTLFLKYALIFSK